MQRIQGSCIFGRSSVLALAACMVSAPAAANAQAAPAAQVAPEAATNMPNEEEIVVTAQKREERLQEVPISISLLQGDDLDRASSVGVVDALRQVPGVMPLQTASGSRSNRSDAIIIR